MKHSDGLAIIDNLFEGKALPDHLARSRAGVVLPKVRTAAETAAEEARKFNDDIAKQAYEKMNKAPLIAVCFAHRCTCGNTWQSFGFHARRVTQRVPGAGDATFTKRLDYDPSPEKPSTIEWQDSDETCCIECYGGPSAPSTPDSKGRIGAVSSLRELVRQNRA